MKRKIWVFVMLAVMLACSLCLFACSKKSNGAGGSGDSGDSGRDDGSHTHKYVGYVCEICYAIDPNAPVTAGLEYTEIIEDEIVIGYSVSKGSVGENKYIKIPARHGDKPVLQIANWAFQNRSSLTSVDIPNSVTSIGLCAFADCSSLRSVELPNSVTSIGENAFAGCSSLMSAEIPNSVTSIGQVAFWDCGNLTSIEIPKSVISIGEHAFSECHSLTIYCEAESKPSGGAAVGTIPLAP